MKSFTFTGLACLLLSAAQVGAIQTEAGAQVDAALEHKHVSIFISRFWDETWLIALALLNAKFQRNGYLTSDSVISGSKTSNIRPNAHPTVKRKKRPLSISERNGVK